MKVYTYEVEVVDEISGTYMDFTYEYEVYMKDDEPVDDSDSRLIQEIMSNISIVPRLISVDGDEE